MSLTRQTFLGATVKSINASTNWDGGGSQLNLVLVEDPANGDRFSPPSEGRPVFCDVGKFHFGGILQKTEQVVSPDGMPTFSVTVVDPRSILEGAQVCLGSYSGPTHGVANLYNVYGFWESQGFGESNVNGAGMPWSKVVTALRILTTSNNAPAFGSPLSFRGATYSLDLSSLPVPPGNYRVGGGTFMSVLDLIDVICQDGGCDYLVDLVGSTIKVRTVSRRNQPSLNTIPKLLNQHQDIRPRASYGREVRNEVTSSFLIGGEQTSLFFSDAISSFWGFDTRGRPILGTPGSVALGGTAVTCDTMKLNATAISDIIGSFSYPSSSVEMQHALGSQDIWLTYMKKHRPAIAKRIGIESAFDGKNNPKKKVDLIDDKAAANISKFFDSDAVVSRINRVYQFVVNHAEEYLGRQFFVRLPFVTRKIDPETFKISTSYEIAESGFVPEGVSPLGLQRIFEDIFRGSDGRFKCFGRYHDTSSADLSNISPQGSILQQKSLYMEGRVHPVIMEAPQPGCVVQMSSPLFKKPVGIAGDKDLLSKTVGIGAQVLAGIQTREHIPLETKPEVFWPSQIAIPLKSNILTYGPWYVAGAPGKVRVEHDSSLTPWNYGDYQTMNAAGNSKVVNSLSNMQVSEMGTIELAEVPRISLGQSLSTGGPYCTNIDIRIDGGGFTSTYRFETYTRKFGVFSKGSVERMRQMGLTAMEVRRNIASRARYELAMGLTVQAAMAGQKAAQNASKILKQKSPHECLVSHTIPDEGGARLTMQTASMEEALALSQAGRNSWSSTAVMGLEGLFRPFTTSTGGSGQIPGFVNPSSNGDIPDAKSLNPFGQRNGTDFLSWGNSFNGLNAYANTPEFDNTRAIGLRGPVIITGPGYDLGGNPVPSDSEGSAGFGYGAWDDPSKSKAGPLDCLWDERRGVWTFHTNLFGTLTTDFVEANGSGEMWVETKDGNGWSQPFYNPWSSELSGEGTKMSLSYYSHLNQYRVTEFDCASGSSV